MSDGGGVENLRAIAMRQGAEARSTETAREHLRNAQMILFNLNVEGNVVQVPLADVRAIEARLRRALEQLERGNS